MRVHQRDHVALEFVFGRQRPGLLLRPLAGQFRAVGKTGLAALCLEFGNIDQFIDMGGAAGQEDRLCGAMMVRGCDDTPPGAWI